MRKRLFLLATLLAIGLTAVTARADIIILEGNSNLAFPVDNVLFNDTSVGDVNVGTTVVGHIQTSNRLVYFTGDGEILTATGGIGQATIDAQDDLLDYLLIALTPPPPDQTETYRSLIFDVAVPAQQSGTLTINVYEPGQTIGGALPAENTLTLTIPQDNPSGFFTVVAQANQAIYAVELIATQDLLADVKQVRLGEFNGNGVPEPSSVLLFGTVLSLVGLVTRRKFGNA